jgi:3',5'-cyclic AMP phosphodiesterase CpdA
VLRANPDVPDILQVSDLHFGGVFLPDRAAGVQRVAERRKPHVVVIAGDFTQRARNKQFEAARSFIDQFEAPIVVTPGNHDLPVYRLIERTVAPYRKYRDSIEESLDQVYSFDGLTIVALNSTRPLRATTGSLSARQLDFAADAFERAPAGHLWIVVTHHHVAYPPEFRAPKAMIGGERVVSRLEQLGVRLLIAGHLHSTLIGDSIQLMPRLVPGVPRRSGLIISQSGTATSTRGRGPERGKNSFNYISIGSEQTVVTHYGWNQSNQAFESVADYAFPSGAGEAGDRPAGARGGEEGP